MELWVSRRKAETLQEVEEYSKQAFVQGKSVFKEELYGTEEFCFWKIQNSQSALYCSDLGKLNCFLIQWAIEGSVSQFKVTVIPCEDKYTYIVLTLYLFLLQTHITVTVRLEINFFQLYVVKI